MIRKFRLRRFVSVMGIFLVIMFIHELLMLQYLDNFFDRIPFKHGELLLGKSNAMRQFYVPDYEHLSAERWVTDDVICHLCRAQEVESDIQMFKLLTGDLEIRGGWGQGLTEHYDPKHWDDKQLHVIIMPHSHCDPGWLKTFEGYYQNHTRLILNNMVKKLQQHKEMTFIYAEMSFFQRWWTEISQQDKQIVRQLLTEGRFEIATGGWVMPDEANSHFFALVDQLVEGHQWARNELGVVPHNGWAIDPFGHSPTMAYITQSAGFNNILIQRVHYAVKNHFAKNRDFEFNWRQNWDSDGSSEVFTHMMPYAHYDHLNTCGPSAGICCQYDFRRQPGWIRCGGSYVQPISEDNVKQKSETILDMYHKKGGLYRSGVVLIPVGDDFRYMTEIEWDQQYENYLKIIQYVNSKPEYNTKMQFGTLSDYFRLVRERGANPYGPMKHGYPTLTGDFFSYADMGDSYWTGYFTSRPFYKRMDRVLEYHLRSAEILYSLALLHSRDYEFTPPDFLLRSTQLIVTSRRSLGLFQHHDGITGTAKDHVVKDYGERMLQGINNAKKVMQNSAQYLLGRSIWREESGDHVHFTLDETFLTHDSLPERYTLDLSYERKVTFYNSLSHDRVSVVTLFVTSPYVEVFNHMNLRIKTIQVSPYWNSPTKMADDKYMLSFLVDVRALSLSTYTFRDNDQIRKASLASTSVRDGKDVEHDETGTSNETQINKHFKVEPFQGEFFISNSELRLKFDSESGMLKAVKSLSANTSLPLAVKFMYYSSRGGAYLFKPTGSPKDIIPKSPFIRVTRGPVYEQVRIFLNEVEHVITLYKSPGIDGQGFDIYNLVDIRSQRNSELAMVVDSAINNKGKEFYTDLNGFQMHKRQYLKKLPLQGNFYPMSSMAYLEGEHHRLNIITAQSLGVTSESTGVFQVMLDRRLSQDDSRGLEQGVLDNKHTPNRFRILLETFSNRTANITYQDTPIGYPSLQAHLTHQELISPLFHLPQTLTSENTSDSLAVQFSALPDQLPCDLDILNLRTLPNSEDNQELRHVPRNDIGLILHRKGVDCRLPLKGATCSLRDEQISLPTLFKDLSLSSAKQTTLTFLDDEPLSDLYKALDIKPMTLNPYKLLYKHR